MTYRFAVNDQDNLGSNYKLFTKAHRHLMDTFYHNPSVEKYPGMMADLWMSEFGGKIICEEGSTLWKYVEFKRDEDYSMFLLKWS